MAIPLRQGDRAKTRDGLELARRDQGIAYLVLFDRKNRIVASSGWDRHKTLPPREALLMAEGEDELFHTEAELRAGNERIGRVALGVSTRFLKTARTELIRENLVIGLIALLLSTALMLAVSYWLTRNLTRLSNASGRLAAGDFNVKLP